MNPFALYYIPEYFCDRKDELNKLLENIQNGRNTLLHSPRRLGKSALIKHLFHTLETEKKYDTLYVDLFATEDMSGLIKAFAGKVLARYHSKNFLYGVKTLLRGVSPEISFSLDGTPQIGLTINKSQEKATLGDIFRYLEKRRKKVIVAFDEFQEAALYPEKAEAVLRSAIQDLSNVQFIFSGSSNHLLRQMFFSAKRPFYQSSEVLALDKIKREVYAGFVRKNFEKSGKRIEGEALEYLLDFSDGYTFYAQLVFNQVFPKAKKITYRDAVEVAYEVLENRKADYQGLLRLLTENQKKVLIAIAKEEYVSQPSSINFIMKNRLSSASSVLQAARTLEEKEILYKTEKGLTVYDIFLKRFLQMYF